MAKKTLYKRIKKKILSAVFCGHTHKDVVEYIKKSPLGRKVFEIEWNFTQGKGMFAKLYEPLNEFSTFIVIMTFFFGIDLTSSKGLVATGGFIVIIALIQIGKYRDASGLFYSEIEVVTHKNHVSRIQYEAAKEILRKSGKLEKYDGVNNEKGY